MGRHRQRDTCAQDDENLNFSPDGLTCQLILDDRQKAKRILGCCCYFKFCDWLTLVSGLMECLCFAGVVFGWASLVYVLKMDGYFSNFCVNSTAANSSTYTDCSGQDEQFALIFTIASFLNSFMAFPLGYVFDRYGTMAARILGIVHANHSTASHGLRSRRLRDMQFCKHSFLSPSLARTLTFPLSRDQENGVGNLFGPFRSTVITLYNGPYDSSSSIFLIIKVLYERGVSLRSSFFFMSACSIIHLLRTFLLMPKTHIPYPLPEDYTYGVSCRGPAVSRELEERTDSSGNVQNEGRIEGVQQEGSAQSQNTPQKAASFRSCVLSWFFLWHLLWLSVMQLRLFLFIDILNPMLDWLTDGDSALVAEKEADLRSSVLSLFLTALLGFLFSVCSTIPVLPLQYLTFVLQVASTSFLFGGNAAFISTAFPSCHYGKLYGLMSTLSAVVLLLQFPILILVNDVLQGNPLYVNIGLTLLTLLPLIHPLYVHVHCQRLAAQRDSQRDGANLWTVYPHSSYMPF
ncbi:hypothetical protein MATL_G00220660 [Megalops atlanticus]|uniref:Solute carrier family 43 member 3 n=1 Tax=Megalops atlanticus TaxID=7932 RepID=A0A9D3PED6_MEGAT|nr:hypothetical protein MATL_G00220660 [Megalops atlanticus]